MGFDIHLRTGADATEPRAMRASLLERFARLELFPLEATDDFEVLWEVNAVEGHLADVIITGWSDSISLEIHSTPLVDCSAELKEIQPIIDFLISCGYVLETENGLLEDYSQQYQRVKAVRQIVSGD